MGPCVFRLAVLEFAGPRAAVLEETACLRDVHATVLTQRLATVGQLGQSAPCRWEDRITGHTHTCCFTFHHKHKELKLIIRRYEFHLEWSYSVELHEPFLHIKYSGPFPLQQH